MELGDGMMIKRIPVVVATCVLLGSGLVALATDSVPVIRGLTAEADPSGTVIHLRTSGELETVHYSPQPGVWIIEMSEAMWDQSAAILSEPELGVERAELTRVEEFGKRVSRLTVWLAEPARLLLVPVDGGLDLQFAALASAVPAAMAAADEVSEEAVLIPPRGGEELPAIPAVTARRTAPDLSTAASLYEVVPVRSGDQVVVELKGDRHLVGQMFSLENPDRLVIDLDNVVNRVDRHLYQVNADLVRRVRVAQFRAIPVPITRVVIDLDGPVSYDLSGTSTGAVITLGDSDAPIMIMGDGFSSATGAGGAISIVPANTTTGQQDAAVDVPSAMFDVPTAATPVSAALEEPVQSVTTVVEQPDRSPFVADPSQLIERAQASQVLNADDLAADEFETTEVETEEQQFTGEPITLTLKDADVKDVLRTFSALTQLNIVLDPSVGGSVTVELREVPWDQALDLILRINGLDYVLENNVLRVAPINKLAQEKSQKAAFEKERERARPLKTVVKPLSYAKASYVAGLLSAESYLLSDRGSVVVDERTNKLILRDVVDRVEGILRLIETLDQPTPQVVIEGRIVETTREFSRELGVVWGFQGTMDALHGNDTGLEFPNSASVAGDVVLPGGANFGTLAFSFADILNTFNLDFLLTAAESDGVAKIVSTPRITTQNLQTAQIRSGLQIPVQTVANNTVTVQYVDATLRLEVTPQITAEGTVNMEIDIRKQEPQLAFAVVGGQNVPIFTRDASTQLLIRDGGTTVIAGIYQIKEETSEDRIPGLHKIPVLGHLFKTRLVGNTHDELLIFITPRIVKY
jgi:type IV pilus assembly protein PilQ